jgi:hypothetical protein
MASVNIFADSRFSRGFEISSGLQEISPEARKGCLRCGKGVPVKVRRSVEKV